MGTVSSSGQGGTLEVYHSNTAPTPDVPWDLLNARFADSLALAEQFKELLVGPTGDGGYLGALQSALEARPSISITPKTVNTSITLRTVGSAPTFNDSELVDIPDETYSPPSFIDLPTVDTSLLVPGTAPTASSPVVSWSSTGFTSDLYADILARLVADLQSGATGLSSAVEQAIIDRAITRNQAANAARYNKLDSDLRARRLSMPSGALAAALVDFSAEITRQETDVSNQVLVMSADLAQKNSQFVITSAIAVEQLLRGTYDGEEGRGLDKAKAVADLLVRDFAERVRAYLAEAEAQKTYVTAQAENLQAVTAANKNLVDLYRTQYEALSTRIDGASKHNKAITDVFVAEMQGFGEEARAYSAENSVQVDRLKALIDDARVDVEAQAAEAKAVIDAYLAWNSLNEKLSNDLAQLGLQGMASALNAVNANASIGYSSGESKSESFGQSISINESHQYPHDPSA